jgi:hypothetical protein
MLRYLEDPRFAPPDYDPHKKWILQRRDAARDYYLHPFYLPRIGVLAAGNALALLLAMAWPVTAPSWVPYVIFMGLLIGNESIMGVWRGRRERRFAAIRRDERRAILGSTREGPDDPGTAAAA